MRDDSFMNHTEQSDGISRRTFIQAASGSLVALPTLAGGLVLAPRPAYADETNSQEPVIQGSEYVVIDVVYPYEVGFMVVDVTKGTVTNNLSQTVKLQGEEKVGAVYVARGDTVSIGDKLFTYDLRSPLANG